jgi:hypothetical protein
MYDGPEELLRLCRGNVMPDRERTLQTGLTFEIGK